ncbi:hypothetical protein L596_007292 [Steinernema carpocapsae]|uniref:Rab5 GDP/GTP exchange factor n=1 Tax=Steinernema carpocapsae TaxID=34508 RepID=A0A4U5P8T0_STECR|nr:hypothetical protein L596_007292 [Steinernema carpocapsae]
MDDLSNESGSRGGMDDKRLRVQITEKELLCVNGCGFYGNPQWKGLCSKCWRAHQVFQKRNEDYARNKSLLNFEKFEERRKLSTDSRSLTLKSILRKPPTSSSQLKGSKRPNEGVRRSASSDFASSSATLPSPVSANQMAPTNVKSRPLSPDSYQAHSSFKEFLKDVPGPIRKDLDRLVTHAVERILENEQMPMDEMSDHVQQFYQSVNDKLSRLPAFEHSKISVEQVMEKIETFICTRAYEVLFCARSDEEVADLSLQDRIRTLHWVTGGFLETTLDFSQSQVNDKVDEAVNEMIVINSHRSARQKLDCLIRCSRLIFEALKESRSGAPASADEYLPGLIYVILKGNPPLIQSNVKFISRFALPFRVMRGESGYYFTNLSCALQFVQNMNAESLNMPKDEFEGYTSGRQVVPLNKMSCGCNQALKSMENSTVLVNQLLDRQKELMAQMKEFEDVIEKDRNDISEHALAAEDEAITEELRKILEEIQASEMELFKKSDLKLSSLPQKEVPKEVKEVEAGISGLTMEDSN